ncbi:MAG: DUF2236 domain-containing protein [Solirubrobacterales bacterium]|nr:DUF2236 domain-containing protein [Solirubrobacterales bacterium]
MLRRIHRERALALSGPRALLMQAAHPLAVSGFLAHSSALDDLYKRLARTAETLSTIWFGSRAEADAMTRQVRAMHRRVRGQLPVAVGPYPKGTPYRADDPELLLWVLFTLVDSGLVVYRKYVRSLSRQEEAAYWEDYKVIGRLFGLRDRDLPATVDDLDAYRRTMLDGDRLFVTEWARQRAKQIVLEPPVPWTARPLLETVNFITIALLPDQIRRQYGFSPLPPPIVRKALVAGGAEYVKRAVLPLLPERLRLVPHGRAGADHDLKPAHHERGKSNGETEEGRQGAVEHLARRDQRQGRANQHPPDQGRRHRAERLG